jgi:hypothetical protein
MVHSEQDDRGDPSDPEVAQIVVNLLAGMRLPVVQICRLYAVLSPCLDGVGRAVAAEESWPLQVIDRRVAFWPDSKPFDFVAGEFVQELTVRPAESVAYDLAEIWRRKRD